MARRPYRRELSLEERALWRRVAADVRPMHPDNGRSETGDASTTPETTPKDTQAKATARSPRRHHHHHRSEVPVHPDARTLRRLRRGDDPIQSRLDLHGMTQDDAWLALCRFIGTAHGRGARRVLVITGKGRAVDTASTWWERHDEPGVLRRRVPEWLSTPPLSTMVAAFASAGPRHGGDGALYVLLRRRR